MLGCQLQEVGTYCNKPRNEINFLEATQPVPLAFLYIPLTDQMTIKDIQEVPFAIISVQ